MSDFVRVPPDSTGKRIRHKRKLDADVTVTNATELSKIQVGDIITSGGKSGEFTGYESNVDGTVSVYISLISATIFSAGDILSFEGTPFATIITIDDLYIQSNVISDGDNPDRSMKIDRSGSIFTRFKDGNALLDSFGNLQTSANSILKSYMFMYSKLPKEFTDKSSAGGSVTHPARGLVL